VLIDPVRARLGSNPIFGAVSRIETGRTIDRFGQPINDAVHRFLRPGPIRDLLSGKAIGHPAHPALASAPIGCWTGALIADVCGERRAGRILTAAGVLSAVPVAATGLSDWADTTGAEQRVGVVHMGLNVTATAVYGASWWARSRRRHGLGIALGAVGAVLATSAGWLGGHLAYGLGVGVDTNSFAGGPTDWTAVSENRPLQRPLSSAKVGGVAVVVVRPDPHNHIAAAEVGSPWVLANRCSHRGGPLAEGELVGTCIRCPWHASEFDLGTGAVRRGPAVVPQPVYEVRGSDEELEVRRDEPRSLRTNSVRP
jgi:nitrite reductase/ring-hydroxylating ferredoxin subunit/uncharacterized membrane protein